MYFYMFEKKEQNQHEVL